MKTKNIIERRLPLDVKYNLIDKNYISLIDGGGTCCDNCGKLIANIATVKNDAGRRYHIGFDCLETFLINNALLDNKGVAEFQHFRQHLPAYIRKGKELKNFIDQNKALNVTGIELQSTDFEIWRKYGKTSALTLYFIFQSGRRYNWNIKVNNEININDLASVLKSVCSVEITIV